LVVTEILAARLVSAWTNPVLNRVRDVALVLAAVFGLVCQVEVMKAFD
jgi:hypothetical protein